jgi:hypothetical protein
MAVVLLPPSRKTAAPRWLAALLGDLQTVMSLIGRVAQAAVCAPALVEFFRAITDSVPVDVSL